MIPPEIVDEFSDQIGGRLLEARENAGLTVEDVQFRTRIPKSVIEALEAGDFSVFSSPTYAKSFLSQYSSFLNVEAALWLDALEPASFISGDNVTPLWKAAGPMPDERAAEPAHTSGWWSALTLFGLTCGLVFAAIKGYEFFESRFGTEVNLAEAKKADEASAPKPVSKPSHPAPQPKSEDEPKRLVQQSEDDLAQPPPRAIIVR